MAARKINRAPPPPALQPQSLLPTPQQQLQGPEADDIVSVISFGVESSSSGRGDGVSLVATNTKTIEVRQRHDSQGSVWSQHQRPSSNSTTVTDGQPHSSQKHQDGQMRLRRTPYVSSKSAAPQPPTSQHQQQILHQPHSTVSTPTPKAVVMHQTVYTRPKEGKQIANPSNGKQISNPFSPIPRPILRQRSLAGSISGSIGNLSMASGRSSGSRKSMPNLSQPDEKQNGTRVKGRLTNLFRRKNRKQLPKDMQHQYKPQQYFSQQIEMRLPDNPQRRHQQPVPQQPPSHQQPLVVRKSLHTFTYTDAKIYNPNNSEVYLGADRRGKRPAPPPPTAASKEGVTPPAPEQTGENTEERTQVWWNMHTMGATRSNYNTNVLLVKNPDPAPDYETATTRF